jgi:hypothetical protein
MSEQRFTIAFREALWDAHNRRCLYCGGELTFVAMKIDHVIPESLRKDWDGLEDVRKRLGLDNQFNVLGFENLAPSCDHCNSRKSSLPLADGAIMIILAKVRDRIVDVELRLHKRAQERSLDNVLRYIARSLDAGEFTREQLLNGLKALEKFPDGIWGASPLAPPNSPEVSKLRMNISDRSKILWSRDALEALDRFQVNAEIVNRHIYDAVRADLFNVRKLPGAHPLYALRLQRGFLRIVFEPREEGTIVHRLYTRGEGSRRLSSPEDRH